MNTNEHHETMTTPSGGTFHYWNRPRRATPQAEMRLTGGDDFALVGEKGADAERAQAEAQANAEAEAAKAAFHAQHQQTLL